MIAKKMNVGVLIMVLCLLVTNVFAQDDKLLTKHNGTSSNARLEKSLKIAQVIQKLSKKKQPDVKYKRVIQEFAKLDFKKLNQKQITKKLNTISALLSDQALKSITKEEFLAILKVVLSFFDYMEKRLNVLNGWIPIVPVTQKAIEEFIKAVRVVYLQNFKYVFTFPKCDTAITKLFKNFSLYVIPSYFFELKDKSVKEDVKYKEKVDKEFESLLLDLEEKVIYP